ncbi:MAG: hypothetical protein ACRDUV_27250 [Pseudonocardiaceae bacterium]
MLAASVVWGTAELFGSCWSPGSGMARIDGECVGVTDGSYDFRPELAGVQQLIEEENARVRRESSSYVTVALLDPLSAASETVLPDGSARHRLEGAYTALRRVNDTSIAGGTEPQIQLVLASEGNTEAQSQQVTDQLVEMSQREENPLVAVIGLGVSTRQTKERAEKLSANRIPMVSAYLIADVLDYEHIKGLIRMSPGSQQYVKALRDYVDRPHTELKKGVVLRDTNSDNGEDLFTQALEEQFNAQMADLIGDNPTQSYTGTGVSTEGVEPYLFDTPRANICAAAPGGLNTILYAGREIDLPAFLDSLQDRPCPNSELTILAAGLDLGEVLQKWEKEQERKSRKSLAEANLEVVFAGTVDVEGWGLNVPGTPAGYKEFLSVFTGQQGDLVKPGFDPGHLDGANAIMMHDALLAAAGAVRLAKPEKGKSPTATGVSRQLLSLNVIENSETTGNAVLGASGTVNFSPDSPKGYPVGKPIPVLQYPQPANSYSRQVEPTYRLKYDEK